MKDRDLIIRVLQQNGAVTISQLHAQFMIAWKQEHVGEEPPDSGDISRDCTNLASIGVIEREMDHDSALYRYSYPVQKYRCNHGTVERLEADGWTQIAHGTEAEAIIMTNALNAVDITARKQQYRINAVRKRRP